MVVQGSELPCGVDHHFLFAIVFSQEVNQHFHGSLYVAISVEFSNETKIIPRKSTYYTVILHMLIFVFVDFFASSRTYQSGSPLVKTASWSSFPLSLEIFIALLGLSKLQCCPGTKLTSCSRIGVFFLLVDKATTLNFLSLVT